MHKIKYNSLIHFFLFLLLVIGCNTTGPASSSTTSTSPNQPAAVKEVKIAKNIIFLIGDGMGLGQITAGMYANGNETVLERFPIVGLHKSYSSDNLVTDSAAGATAFASGVKTYNGAVGVDVNKQPVKTILEEAEEKGMKTGLVATSSIVHATPACFIAHVETRKEYEQIAAQFLETEIDIFIGGGKAYFDRREDERNLYEELRDKGYMITDYFTKPLDEIVIPRNKKFGYFTADKEPLSFSQGRDYLVGASQKAIEYLDKTSKDQGFFVMIEGSQIDWGGHANDPNYVLTELQEYEEVIGHALDFAEKDGNTLVIVTADHETGGFAINPESTLGDLKIAFTTGGHTASLIPVFAYGPGAEIFGGMYENTEIYFKMKQALGILLN
jgi:alkaline phosphatase